MQIPSLFIILSLALVSAAQTLYPLYCRGADHTVKFIQTPNGQQANDAGTSIIEHTGDGMPSVAIAFNKGTVAKNPKRGECVWADRAMWSDEPSLIKFTFGGLTTADTFRFYAYTPNSGGQGYGIIGSAGFTSRYMTYNKNMAVYLTNLIRGSNHLYLFDAYNDGAGRLIVANGNLVSTA